MLVHDLDITQIEEKILYCKQGKRYKRHNEFQISRMTVAHKINIMKGKVHFSALIFCLKIQSSVTNLVHIILFSDT